MDRNAHKALICLIVLVLVTLLARMMVKINHLEERIWILEHSDRVMADGSSILGLEEDPAMSTSPAEENTSRSSQSQGGRAGYQAPAYTPWAPSTSQQEQPSDRVASVSEAHQEPSRPSESAKFSSPHLLDLNSVDSVTLVRIPGIAGRTASVILNYRKRLGGFYHPRQLSERLTWDAAQQQMDDWCTQWFYADTTRIVPVRVNQLPFKELLRHPYLEYPQVQELVQYRDRYKRIPALSALRQMPSFSDADIQRLSHYLSFE